MFSEIKPFHLLFAEAYGCDAETVRGWEKRFKKSDALELEREKSFARNAFSNLNAAKKRNETEYMKVYEGSYGAKVLPEDGKQYQTLETSGKQLSAID